MKRPSPQMRSRKLRNQAMSTPREHLKQLQYLPAALHLVWEAAPRWTAALFILLVAGGLLPALTVYLTRDVVDGLSGLFQAGQSDFSMTAALRPMLLLAVALGATEVIAALSSYVRTGLAEQVQDRMNARVHAQSLALDLHFFESPAYYDQLYRASIEAIDRPLALLETMATLTQSTLTLLAMAALLAGVAWWMPLLLIVGALPSLGVAMRVTWRMNQWRLQRTFDQRRLSYLHHLISGDAAAAELRLFGLGDTFTRRYDRLRSTLRTERLALARESAAFQMGAGLLALLSIGVALLWLLRRAMQGLLTLGDAAMIYQAMMQGQRLSRTLLGGAGELYRNLLFLEDLFCFLELTPTLRDPEMPVALPPLRKALQLEHVTLRYPHSPRVALDDLSLTLPAGQITAIVGDNGAGKSSLVKLLARLYDPTEGRITWDGIPLTAVRLDELRQRITVLMQKPFDYHESVADNIAFGNVALRDDRDQIELAAKQAGAETIIEGLPDRYETILSRIFGSTTLSVGEWQRIALARTFLRGADVVILDEPTSAMDSWAEQAWMARFRDIVAGRTTLIITHRFTTAMQADIIHVMAGGRVVESGTHAQLVAQGGRYAESWQRQMQRVADNEGLRAGSVVRDTSGSRVSYSH